MKLECHLNRTVNVIHLYDTTFVTRRGVRHSRSDSSLYTSLRATPRQRDAEIDLLGWKTMQLLDVDGHWRIAGEFFTTHLQTSASNSSQGLRTCDQAAYGISPATRYASIT